MEEMRLQKYLSRCAVGSRRACERLIGEGRVQVDGEVVTEPGTVVREGMRVLLDGSEVEPLKLRYYLVNKPVGIISVNRDPRGRRYVVDLVKGGNKQGLFPVGRLDIDTSGLMVLTNDGDLANMIAHPRYGVEKEYSAVVKGALSDEVLRGMESGVRINGKRVDLKVLDSTRRDERTNVRLRIKEGRYHIVRRVFLAVGSRVIRLHRTAIGSIRADDLPPGGYREVDRSLIVEGCSLSRDHGV